MFKPKQIKRKKRITVEKDSSSSENSVTSTNDDKEETNISSKIQKLKKTKKAKLTKRKINVTSSLHTTKLSFGDDQEDGDNEKVLKRKKDQKHKIKKKSGFGYGGALGNTIDDTNNETIEEKKESYYSKQELDQLKKEQNVRKSTAETDAIPEMATAAEDNKDEELDFISLHSNDNTRNNMKSNTASSTLRSQTIMDLDNVIYAGDDAISMMNKTNADEEKESDISAHAVLKDDDFINNNNIESKTKDKSVELEEDKTWEEQILKRTNIAPSVSFKTKNSHDTNHEPLTISQQRTTMESTTTPTALHSKIQSKLTKLQQNKEQLQTKQQKIQIEISALQNELSSYNTKQANNQTQFDFYTSLRYNIASTLSKIRDLNHDNKISLVYESYIDYYKDYKHIIFKFWNKVLYDDIIASLEPDNEDEVTVDEFGRNIIPFRKLEQMRRISSWKDSLIYDKQDDLSHKLDNTLNKLGDDNDMPSSLLSATTTISEMKEKRSSLLQAISALFQTISSSQNPTDNNDISDVSTSVNIIKSWIEQLLSLSKSFFTHSKEEYEQIYASASFAELLGICVKLLSCQLFHFLGNSLHQTNNNECTIQGIPLLFQTNYSMDNLDNHDAIIQSMIIHKTILPMIESIIQNGYNPISTIQSQAISKFITSMLPFIRQIKRNKQKMINVLSKLLSSLILCFKDTFQLRFLNLPLKCPSPFKNAENKDISYAMEQQREDKAKTDYLQIMYLVQLHKCKQFILNICKYWEPIFFHECCDQEVKQELLHYYNELGTLVIDTIFLKMYVPTMSNDANGGSLLNDKEIQKEFQTIITCFLLDTNWLRTNDNKEDIGSSSNENKLHNYILIDYKHIWDKFGVNINCNENKKE